MTRAILSFGVCIVLIFVVCECVLACQDRRGCRIHAGTCLCGIGCEYRYADQFECRKALKGRRNDICQKGPCRHGGTCTQSLSNDAGYKCRCDGTGYYGKQCENACPRADSLNHRLEDFPYECIVI